MLISYEVDMDWLQILACKPARAVNRISIPSVLSRFRDLLLKPINRAFCIHRPSETYFSPSE